jgi:predicted PurR-regulated permease PerM
MEPPVPREHASGTSSGASAEDRPATAAPSTTGSELPSADATDARRPTGRRLGAPTPRAALTIGAALLVIVIMLAAFDAVRPFLLGAVLVYLMAPLVDRLTSVGIPRAGAVLLTFATVIFVIVAVLMLSLSPLIAQLQRFIQDVPTIVHDARPALEDFYAGLNLSPEVRAFVDSILASLAEGAGGIDIGGVAGPVFGSLFSVLGAITAYAILPAWLFFLLKDRTRLSDSLEQALPPTWRADVFAIFALVDRVFGNWIRGQLVLGATVGLASFIGLEILGVVVDPVFGRYAILLALTAGLLELVPFIGPIISAIPAILIGLTAGPQGFLAAFLLYLGIQQLENNLLVPKIQGDAVELHPSVVLIALVVGTSLAGILGAILSLPIAAAARDVFRYLFRRLSDPPATVAESLSSISPKLVAAVRPSTLALSRPGAGLENVASAGTAASPRNVAAPRDAASGDGGAATADGA